MSVYDSWLNEEKLSKELKEFYTNEAMEKVGPMAILDKDFRIVFINDKYADTMGVNKAESLGKSIYDVIDNTNMTSVALSKHPELGILYKRNNIEFILNKFPIFKNDELVGIVGISAFANDERMSSLKLKLSNLSKELNYYKDKNNLLNTAKYDIDSIVTNNYEMLKLKSFVHKVAHTKSTVLISGESGTGKELFAHSIHTLSNRNKMPFVRINCSAIPENLIESELFGYEKGSFTGALKDGKIGEFEIANGGTILMDEIDSLPLTVQPKLLRVLQEREIRRIGGNETINVDVRMIFTSNKNLISLIEKGKFREDLFYRINVMNINIPPLRERKEDIPFLVSQFIEKYNNEFGMNIKGITKEAKELLLSYQWPGNVRELENSVERAFINSNGKILSVEHFDLISPSNNIDKKTKINYSGKTLKDIVSEVEIDVIQEYLIKTGGNKKKTAELLGLDRSVLYDKIKKYELYD